MDLEMTGLNPFRHGVIEVGMMVMDEKFAIIGELFMDLCPPPNIVIDPDSLEYNGFTLDRIASGRSYEEFVERFDAFMMMYFNGVTPILVGQYITADISFLGSIFSYVRRNDLFLRMGNDIIDTKSIANERNALARYQDKVLPFESTSLSKKKGIADVLNLSPFDAHTARGDILATREALIRFLGISPDLV